MTWTDENFSFGAILLSDEMAEMQANFEAMANGDSGAPRLDWEAFTRDITYTEEIIQLDTVDNVKSLLKGFYNIYIDPSAFSPATTKIVRLEHNYNGNWIDSYNQGFVPFSNAPTDPHGIIGLYVHMDNEYRLINYSVDSSFIPDIRIIRYD